MQKNAPAYKNVWFRIRGNIEQGEVGQKLPRGAVKSPSFEIITM